MVQLVKTPGSLRARSGVLRWIVWSNTRYPPGHTRWAERWFGVSDPPGMPGLSMTNVWLSSRLIDDSVQAASNSSAGRTSERIPGSRRSDEIIGWSILTSLVCKVRYRGGRAITLYGRGRREFGWLIDIERRHAWLPAAQLFPARLLVAGAAYPALVRVAWPAPSRQRRRPSLFPRSRGERSLSGFTGNPRPSEKPRYDRTGVIGLISAMRGRTAGLSPTIFRLGIIMSPHRAGASILASLPTLISLPAVRIASKSSRCAVGRPMATEVILGGSALRGARSKSPVLRSPTAHSVAAADRRPKLARSSWSTLLHRLLRAGAPLFLLATADGCAPMPPTTASVTVPLVRPGEARVWFYRTYEPYAGKGRPSVAINGTYAGIAELGGAFYRDVPPGHYLATVETYGIDFSQVANFDLAPGQEAYVKIVSSPSWYEDGDKRAFERPTYYAWLIAGNIARAQITHLAFYGGS
jgi:hypothetical protein